MIHDVYFLLHISAFSPDFRERRRHRDRKEWKGHYRNSTMTSVHIGRASVSFGVMPVGGRGRGPERRRQNLICEGSQVNWILYLSFNNEIRCFSEQKKTLRRTWDLDNKGSLAHSFWTGHWMKQESTEVISQYFDWKILKFYVQRFLLQRWYQGCSETP